MQDSQSGPCVFQAISFKDYRDPQYSKVKCPPRDRMTERMHGLQRLWVDDLANPLVQRGCCAANKNHGGDKESVDIFRPVKPKRVLCGRLSLCLLHPDKLEHLVAAVHKGMNAFRKHA
ncbi:hypothetical protein AD930_07975 [Acetobacter malorum]|nr:hypothetical protein AD930_07975 [Acetobacter malorum]